MFQENQACQIFRKTNITPWYSQVRICFLETPVFGLALLPYYRRYIKSFVQILIYLIFLQGMQVGDTVTLISVLLQSIPIKKVNWKWQIINLVPRGFCLFNIRTAKKNIDVLISKRQKPPETGLASNLPGTPACFLLTYFQYLRPCPNFLDSQITAFLSKMESLIIKQPEHGCDLIPVGWFSLT